MDRHGQISGSILLLFLWLGIIVFLGLWFCSSLNYIMLYHTGLCEFLNYCGTLLVLQLQQSGIMPHSKCIWHFVWNGLICVNTYKEIFKKINQSINSFMRVVYWSTFNLMLWLSRTCTWLPPYNDYNPVCWLYGRKGDVIIGICVCVLCCRLRCLVKQLERGEASVAELKKNLEYAALVLESLYIEETRQGSLSSVLLYQTCIFFFKHVFWHIENSYLIHKYKKILKCPFSFSCVLHLSLTIVNWSII